MNVIDLSDWNDRLDYDCLRDNGIEGMIAKISEGRTLSQLYTRHISEAVARRMPWGVYAFTHAQTTERAEEEANQVIKALRQLQQQGYGKPDLGIWFDVESSETTAQDVDDATAICSKFIATCNAAEYAAGIYANYYTFCSCLDIWQLADYVQYWCAQYSDHCDFQTSFPGKKLAGWQQAETFMIDGKNYDISWFYD